jgi:hypothetical protein
VCSSPHFAFGAFWPTITKLSMKFMLLENTITHFFSMF